MINKQIQTDLGSYTQSYNHGYTVHTWVNCIDSYKEVPENEQWMNCPCCGLKPKIWEFNNGMSTACGCWESRYDHFSVCSESIMSVHTRTDGKKMTEYKSDQLRLNWNEYCSTMVSPCSHGDLKIDGRDLNLSIDNTNQLCQN